MDRFDNEDFHLFLKKYFGLRKMKYDDGNQH